MQNLNSLAIRFLPQNRRQMYLLLALGATLLGGAIVVWYGFFRVPSLEVAPVQLPPPQVVEIDFGVFETPVFQTLGSPLPPIPFPDEVGKRNPFIPTQ